MPMAMPSKPVQRLIPCVLVAVAAIFTGAGPALAGYGPPPGGPPGGPGPGGYNCVITSRTVDPYEATTIGPLRVGALRVIVRIRAYTFPDPVQVTITEPFSAAGACQGGAEPHIRGFHVIGGVGILVDLASSPFGSFPEPVLLTIREVGIKDVSTLEITTLGGRRLIKVSGPRTREPWTVKADTSAGWAVLVNNPKPPRRHHRHAPSTRRHPAAGDSGTLTAALLPAGAWSPGLGVLALADGRLVLTASGHAADAR
jgi:hypothetical protein